MVISKYVVHRPCGHTISIRWPREDKKMGCDWCLTFTFASDTEEWKYLELSNGEWIERSFDYVMQEEVAPEE